MNFKIDSLKIIPISIPLKKPMYMSGRCLTHAENLIIRVESNGIVGWGEAASAPRMTGDILPGMKAVVEKFFKSIVIGKSIEDYRLLSSLINKSVYGNTGAKSAMNSALLDLYSKVHCVTLHSLLGEKRRDNFKSMVILGNKTLEEDLEEAGVMRDNGIDFFKIKIGKYSVLEEIDHTHKIRQIIGSSSQLCVDANTGLTIEDLKLYIQEIKSVNLLFLEQPLENIDQTASLKLNIPICMDESVSSKESIIEIKNKNAGQGINLKNIKLCGPLYVAEAATIAHKLEMEINISAKVAETGIATSSLLHCAAVSPNINWGISTTNQYLLTDIIKAPKTNVLEAFEVDEYILKQFIYDV